MKRTAILTATVATALALTACGSSEPTDTAGAFTPADTTGNAEYVGNTNYITKTIGESAGIKNPAGGDYLNVTATDITRTQQCTNVYDEPIPGNYVKVTLHIVTDQFPTMEMHMLSADNWSTVTPDGMVNSTPTSCEGSTDLLGLDETGTRDATFYLTAPPEADTVRYTAPNMTDATGGWEWSIPR